ncbi:MAG: AgmX/PglI C-terminal domain-containing protein [Deltaproteobacteria bacterium]|nr:AgmX/PglI C-terminal domain-containing protein [Deltaproteobacteria bacterium]
MSKKKKALRVSVEREGKGGEEILAGEGLTVGGGDNCDIVAAMPGVGAGRFRLIEKSGREYLLRIPEGMDGTVSIGGGTPLSIKGLREFDLLKKKGDAYILSVPEEKQYTLASGGLVLRLDWTEITAPPPAVYARLDRSLRRHWISREDYVFISVLLVSVVIHAATVAFLNRMKIKKMEPMAAIESIAPRFARLILEPPKTEAVKKALVAPVSLPEEVKEEKKEEPQKKAKEGKKEAAKEEPAPGAPAAVEEAALPPQGAEAPSAAEIRQTVQARVKSRGLLGVIMSKARPAGVGGADVFERAQRAIRSVDKKGGGEASTEEILSSLETRAGVSSGDIALNAGGGKGKDTGQLIGGRRTSALLPGGGGKKGDDKASLRARDEAEVYKTVQAYIGGLKYIYNNALRKDSTLKGKVTVKIVISPDGKVAKAEMVSTTLDSSETVEAIVARITRWKFPTLLGGEEYIITYTFDFSPVG